MKDKTKIAIFGVLLIAFVLSTLSFLNFRDTITGFVVGDEAKRIDLDCYYKVGVDRIGDFEYNRIRYIPIEENKDNNNYRLSTPEDTMISNPFWIGISNYRLRWRYDSAEVFTEYFWLSYTAKESSEPVDNNNIYCKIKNQGDESININNITMVFGEKIETYILGEGRPVASDVSFDEKGTKTYDYKRTISGDDFDWAKIRIAYREPFDFRKDSFDVIFETDEGDYEDTIYVKRAKELVWLGDRYARISNHCRNICDEHYLTHPDVNTTKYYPIEVHYTYHSGRYCRCFDGDGDNDVDIMVLDYHTGEILYNKAW